MEWMCRLYCKLYMSLVSVILNLSIDTPLIWPIRFKIKDGSLVCFPMTASFSLFRLINNMMLDCGLHLPNWSDSKDLYGLTIQGTWEWMKSHTWMVRYCTDCPSNDNWCSSACDTLQRKMSSVATILINLSEGVSHDMKESSCHVTATGQEDGSFYGNLSKCKETPAAKYRCSVSS